MKYDYKMDSLEVNTSPNQNINTYIAAHLLKREADKKWVQYWVVLRGQYMVFYSEKCKGEREFIQGFIEISTRIKCLITERRKFHFPFFVSTERAKYYFKCESAASRHQWINAIISSSKGLTPLGGHQSSFSNPGYEKSPEIEDRTMIDCISSSDKSTDSEEMSLYNIDDSSSGCMTPANNDTLMDIDYNIPNLIVVESKNSAASPTVRSFMSQPVEWNKDYNNKINRKSPNGIVSPYPSSKSHSIFRLQKNKRNLHNHFLDNKNSILHSRPSTSPECSIAPLSNVTMNVFSDRETTKSFSRHFTFSAPDIQSLIIEDS